MAWQGTDLDCIIFIWVLWHFHFQSQKWWKKKVGKDKSWVKIIIQKHFLLKKVQDIFSEVIVGPNHISHLWRLQSDYGNGLVFIRTFLFLWDCSFLLTSLLVHMTKCCCWAFPHLINSVQKLCDPNSTSLFAFWKVGWPSCCVWQSAFGNGCHLQDWSRREGDWNSKKESCYYWQWRTGLVTLDGFFFFLSPIQRIFLTQNMLFFVIGKFWYGLTPSGSYGYRSI